LISAVVQPRLSGAAMAEKMEIEGGEMTRDGESDLSNLDCFFQKVDEPRIT
jgi:hypothetical protein